MEIYIYVYYIQFLLFFRLEHTEIRFGPIFVGYGPSGLRVSNFARRDLELKTIMYAGNSDMTLREFYVYLRELRIVLESKKYCLFFWNCRHITHKIIVMLNCQDSQGNLI